MAAKQAVQKVLIVGGVAGGASCAARLRRLSEAVQVTIFEKGPCEWGCCLPELPKRLRWVALWAVG